MDKIQPYIESLIFASDAPINVEEINEAIERYSGEKISEQLIDEYIELIREKYNADENQVIELIEISNAFQFLTKSIYHPLISAHVRNRHKRKLSRTALETLAVIAYKQPVTKPEVEQIRGVSCDYAVQKLLEKDLVTIIGRAESPGKPILYGTSDKFMRHFGMKNLNDLPKLNEVLISDDNSVGQEGAILLSDYQPESTQHDFNQSDSEE